jgi:tetratricopeptide (TPR) repeat protein
LVAKSTCRVFLSHSSSDKDFVRELERRLTRDGVPCFFDEKSIGWGDDFVRALERAIDECEFVVFVLSPDFCESKWAEVERTSSIADDPDGLKRKGRPLMRRDCRHLSSFPRFLRQVQSINVRTDEEFDREYPRICEELGGIPKLDEALDDRTRLPPVEALPARHRMPYRALSEKFVGRVEEFWKLHDALRGGRAAVVAGTGLVVGAGGLGKTQLAIEYAHRFGRNYPGGVYWVDAEAGLSELVARVSEGSGIEIDGKAPVERQVEQLWRELNAFGTALVILDNFPESGELRPFLPVGIRVSTLVTSRRRDLDQASVLLDPLSVEEGVRLLNSGHRKFEYDEAARLVERLGGLPLAIELARGYLNYRRHVTIGALFEEFQSGQEMEMLAEFQAEYRAQLPSGHEKDVARTFALSWQAVGELGRDVLRAMSGLAPVAVPHNLMRLVFGSDEAVASSLKDPLGRALDELARLSLVEMNEDGDAIAHRLVLAYAHKHGGDGEVWRERRRAAVRGEIGRASLDEDGETMRALEAVGPHAEFLLMEERVASSGFLELANQLGIHYQAIGRYSEAKRVLAKSLTAAEMTFEVGHPQIASTQSNLAMVLKDLGQFDQARDLLHKALASDERTFKPGDPKIAERQANLAIVLHDLGEMEEAQDLARKALASDEKTFAPGHPTIAVRQTILARLLMDLGKFEEARDLLRKVLAADEKAFAIGHPEIATDQSNLAMVLLNLGELKEAEELMRKALASDERTFKSGSPRIAIRHANLALVLQKLGKLEEARELLRKALVSDEKTYQVGHPTIAIRQSNLAVVLKGLGELEEAGDLLRNAHRILLARFGSDHPLIKKVPSQLEGLE